MTDAASPDLAALARRLHELASADPARAHLAEQCDKIVRSTETAQRAVCESACQALVALLAQAGQHESGDRITMGQAATLLRCSVETATKKVAKHGLGVKVSGRWYVSRSRCIAWMEGRAYATLTDGDGQIR